KADKSGANFALIIGEEEAEHNKVAFKFLRESRPQQTLAHEQIIDILKTE
ncbi:MAG: histidine--tRNA ligase, partial [Methylococcales bacterium]|nr:histidine--tRNA ligase [Methylococcales bacterium]